MARQATEHAKDTKATAKVRQGKERGEGMVHNCGDRERRTSFRPLGATAADAEAQDIELRSVLFLRLRQYPPSASRRRATKMATLGLTRRSEMMNVGGAQAIGQSLLGKTFLGLRCQSLPGNMVDNICDTESTGPGDLFLPQSRALRKPEPRQE